MDELDRMAAIHRPRPIAEQQVYHLEILAHQWDSTIRRALKHLGQTLWPDGHILGLLPVHHFRVRYRAESRSHTWWVEHDIAAHRQRRRVAYCVQLRLDQDGHAVLVVQSGTGEYRANPIASAVLEATLARAAEDPPLVIQRNPERAGGE